MHIILACLVFDTAFRLDPAMQNLKSQLYHKEYFRGIPQNPSLVNVVFRME